MLDVALTFLVKSLNAYLMARTGSSVGAAALCPIADDAGKWLVDPGSIGVSLVSVEEERALRAQAPDYTLVNGKHVVLPPPLKLNLHVLFAARFATAKTYDLALRYLSYVLTYFQAHPSFTSAESPDLDPRIDRLAIELLSLSYDQLNQMWAFLGAKQLPAAVYRVRLVLLQDIDAQIATPIDRISTEAHER